MHYVALELLCPNVNFSNILNNMRGPKMINPCCGAIIIAVADALNELKTICDKVINILYNNSTNNIKIFRDVMCV